MKNKKVSQQSKTKKKPVPAKEHPKTNQDTEPESLDNALRTAAGLPVSLSPADVLHLSRKIGNRATGKLLQSR